MDKAKRSFKFLKFFSWAALSTVVGLLLYSSWIYFTLPEIEAKKCMTTKLFKVPLCPGKNGYIFYKTFPKDLVDALVLSEDGSFFSHHGFDWYEIKESFKQNWKKGRIARGGSTITQQLAKNMYLSKDKTITRKIKEYLIANQLEEKLKKFEILERYLNIVEFGPKLYGVKKAARHYFNKSVSQLSFLESVYLISLLPSPVRLSRGFSTRQLTSSNTYRMKIIIRRFFRSGKIDQESYEHFRNLVQEVDWPFGNTFEHIPSMVSELEDEIQGLQDDADNTSIEDTQEDLPLQDLDTNGDDRDESLEDPEPIEILEDAPTEDDPQENPEG